jgi:WD40 repeat protein/serine/threonine protein kinase
MAVFEKAIGTEGSAREQFLTQECGADQGLRAEVEKMLGHAAAPSVGLTAGGGMAPSVAGRIIGKASIESASKALMPLLKGEYRILGTVGHGGMGVVYRAEQSIPRRIVAIKAIRPGLTSRQVLRRFEHEAHILGRLQHPGIAQVYEAGAASSARADEAFFVMEYVDGSPITDYARSAGLGVQEKLEIIARVADAVQHAHQRRVIHRDIKPGNILVTRDGQPKILDFGVARLDSAEGTESITRQTHAGQLIGTLAYMAPEQLEGAEVDARADVYALGVVLYQLLTGKLPHDFKGSSLLEAARLIREEEPARITRVDPSLRGDIDIIVQKSTERDRERRYQSASDLAADIRRHLRGEPIQARADSAVYVIRKQLSRHKGPTAAIIAALLGLAGFSVYASVQSSRQATARQLAETNAARYRAQLSVNNIERGRLLGMTGNFPAAEQFIWNEHAASPSDLSYWALWELYSRTPTRATLGGHPREVRYVAASRNSRYAATVSAAELHLWETTNWTCTHVLSMPEEIRAVRFSPDGSFVLATCLSGQTGVWRTSDGERIGGAACDKACGMAIAPTGEAPWPVAVMGRSEGVLLYKLSSDGSLVADSSIPFQTPPTAEQAAMAMNADRTLLAAGFGNGTVRVWRLDSGEMIWENHEHRGIIGGLAFSPDGGTLVTGSNDKMMFSYDVAGYTITSSPGRAHTQGWDNGTVRSLNYSDDGKYVVAAGYWRTEVWDALTHAVAKGFVRCPETGGSAVWLGNDSMILATGSGSFARVWDAHPNGHMSKFSGHPGGGWCAAISPSGDLAATAGDGGEVRLWKWPSMEPAFDVQPPHSGRVRALAFSHDGRTLASGGTDGVLRLWDLESRHCRLTFDSVHREYYDLAFSPDDRFVVATNRDGAARLIDASTGDVAASLTGGPATDGHLSAAFSPDGQSIASTHGHVLTVWNAPFTDPGNNFEQIGPSGWSLCWLDQPGIVALGGWEGKIDLWDTRTGTRVQTLAGHTQIVTSVTLGPPLSNGHRALVSSSTDGTIKMWNPETGNCLLTLSPEAGTVSRVAASADGMTLLSTHEDGWQRVWDLTYYQPHIRSAAVFHQPSTPPP